MSQRTAANPAATSGLVVARDYPRLWRGAVGTLSFRIFSALLIFTSSVLIARMLSVADYGAYTYALAWLYLLATPGCLGTDRLLIRKIAIYQANEDWDKTRALLRWSSRITFTGSLVIIAVVVLLSFLLLPGMNSVTRDTLLISLLALPFLISITLKQSALQGMHDVLRGQLSEFVVRPVLILGTMTLLYFLGGRQLHAPAAAGVTVLAAALTFLVASRLLKHTLPRSDGKSDQSDRKDWARHALPLLLLSTLGMITTQVETLILGAATGMEAVAYFSVANRGAELVSLPLLVFSVPLAPMFARLWATKDVGELQRATHFAASASLLASVPILTALLVFAPWILALFGPGFAAAQRLLSVLSAGQFLNVLAGPAALLLIMSGHERETVVATGVSILLKVLLCAWLIPSYGALGAAMARSGSLVFWNLLLLYFAYRQLSINPTVFARSHAAMSRRR